MDCKRDEDYRYVAVTNKLGTTKTCGEIHSLIAPVVIALRDGELVITKKTVTPADCALLGSSTTVVVTAALCVARCHPRVGIIVTASAHIKCPHGIQ